jgi:hypothetical protein
VIRAYLGEEDGEDEDAALPAAVAADLKADLNLAQKGA